MAGGGGVTTGLGDSATHLPENYLFVYVCVRQLA